ncbi:hypothetical protein Tco_1424508 [Tanacetum coccineum]
MHRGAMMMVGYGQRWPEVMGCDDDVVMVAAVEDGGVTSGRDGSVVELVFGGEGLGWRRLVVKKIKVFAFVRNQALSFCQVSCVYNVARRVYFPEHPASKVFEVGKSVKRWLQEKLSKQSIRVRFRSDYEV